MRKLALLPLFALALVACEANPTGTDSPSTSADTPLFTSIPVADCPADQSLVEANGFEADDKNGDGWVCTKTNGAGKVLYGDNNVNSTPGERPIDSLPPEAANGILHACLDPSAYSQLPVQTGSSCSALCSAVREDKCSVADCQQLCVVAGGTLGLTVDATALSAAAFFIGGVPGAQDPTVPQLYDLPPGVYGFAENAGGSFQFVVTDDRLLEFDSSLDAFVSGRGTSTLTVSGFPIDVDATALSSNYFIGGVGGVQPSATVNSYRFIPGTKGFAENSSTGGFQFTITSDGNLEFDSSLDAFVSGRGTSTLTVSGFPIDVDATALSSNYFIGGVGGVQPSATVNSYRFIPGTKGFAQSGGGISFDFDIGPTGLLAYDPALEPQVTGAGTSTLTVVP